MKKRVIISIFVIIILISTIFLSACNGSSGSGGASGPGSSNGTSGSGDEITLTFLRLANDEAETAFWADVIASYQDKNPNVKIEYDNAAIGDDMDVKLTSLFAANSGPDIVGHGIMSIAGRVNMGHYTPITDYFNNWEGRDDIFSQLVDLGTFNNEIYGIAYQPTPYVFAYRTDLLNEAGFDRPPETWEELAEYARALTVTENGRITRAGFAFPASAGNFVEYDVFAYGNGGGFVDNNGDPTMDLNQNIEALDFLASFIYEVSLEFNANETNPFLTGNAAMTLIDNIRLTPMFSVEEYEGKIGISLPPSNAGQRRMTFSGCRLLFIGKDCQNRDAAFDFIAYAVSKEVIEKRSVDLNVPVVRASLADMFAAKDPFNAVRVACVENGIGMPIATWASMFQRVRNEAVQRMWHGDDSTIILNEAQDKLLAEIAAAG